MEPSRPPRHIGPSVPALLACACSLAWLLAPAPAGSQEVPAPGPHPSVQSTWYTLVGNDLTIEVDGAAPGSLLVMRAGTGRVHVRARSDDGLAGVAFAEGGRARLRLSGLGEEPIGYVVVVPERARVSVRLPGHDLPATLRTLEATRTFEWDRHEPEPGAAPGAPGRH